MKAINLLFKIKERLENINVNLSNPNMPNEIHVMAFKEIIPEIVEEIEKSKLIDIDFDEDSDLPNKSVDVFKVFELWFKDLEQNPTDFCGPDSDDYNSENSAKAFLSYVDKLE